jgi:hypothetical protein
MEKDIYHVFQKFILLEELNLGYMEILDTTDLFKKLMSVIIELLKLLLEKLQLTKLQLLLLVKFQPVELQLMKLQLVELQCAKLRLKLFQLHLRIEELI